MVKIGGKASKISKRRVSNENKKSDIILKPATSEDKLVEDVKTKLNPFESWGIKIDVNEPVVGAKTNENFNKNISTSLLDKYWPKIKSDLVGLTTSLSNLDYWFNEKHEDSNNPFLVLGPIGCGKSTLITYFLKSNNFPYFLYNTYFGHMTKKDILYKFKNYLQHNTSRGVLESKGTPFNNVF